MTEVQQTTTGRKVGILLGIGIFLLPIAFAWLTLRKGHSTLSRVVSFVWMAVTLIVGFSMQQPAADKSPSADQVAASVAAIPAPPRSAVTMANYQRIETGMSYAEVVAILGAEGEELSSNELAGIKTVMYQWNGGFGANMNVMFQNDEMVQKAQMGLK